MAVNDIIIRPDNTINGNATAGRRIRRIGNAQITGAVNIAPVAPTPLPVISFTAGGNNITVRQNQSRTLAPGSYGQVRVSNGGRLFLTSGEYFMSRLEMSASTLLTCDVTAGPITINVVGSLKFGQRARVVITPAGPLASAQVGFLTMSTARVEIGARSLVRGAIIAPRATVELQRNSQFKGSICAEKIDVRRGARFFHHTSASLNKSDEDLEVEEFDEEESKVSEPVTSYQLEQNYPNPFNPSTTINFALPEAGEVTLTIYNLNGQLVKQLVAGEMQVGRHSVIWDAKDGRGQKVASGVYLYVLKAGSFVSQRKLVLMK